MANKNSFLWLTGILFGASVAIYLCDNSRDHHSGLLTLWSITWGTHLLGAVLDLVRKQSWMTNLTWAIIFISLGLLIGTSGLNPSFFDIEKVYRIKAERMLYCFRLVLFILIFVLMIIRHLRSKEGNPGDELYCENNWFL